MKKGKNYRESEKSIDRAKTYELGEAIDMLQGFKKTKFDQSVEVHIKTSIDTKKSDQLVRGTIILPHGTGKNKKIAVITSTAKSQEEAKKAGAEIVGGEEMIEKFAKKIEFDVLVATPEMMPKLAKVAKILGPKGLMPNPKTETVTTKITETVEALKKGKATFKNDDTGNIHQIVGKISFDKEKLVENIKAQISGIEKARPSAVKGKFIRSITICSTMSPAIKIKI